MTRLSHCHEAVLITIAVVLKAVIIGVLLLSIVVYLIDTIEPRYPPGVLIPEEPDQQTVNSSRSWPMGKYQIMPLAEFRLRARVLHTEPYWLDGGADLSPVDLALGWGRMSDQSVVDELEFWQGQRWYRYWPRKSKVPDSAGRDGLAQREYAHDPGESRSEGSAEVGWRRKAHSVERLSG